MNRWQSFGNDPPRKAGHQSTGLAARFHHQPPDSILNAAYSEKPPFLRRPIQKYPLPTRDSVTVSAPFSIFIYLQFLIYVSNWVLTLLLLEYKLHEDKLTKCIPRFQHEVRSGIDVRFSVYNLENPLGDNLASQIRPRLSLSTPWTEEPGWLQSMRLQRVGHDWAFFMPF